jgi:EpsI family protein
VSESGGERSVSSRPEQWAISAVTIALLAVGSLAWWLYLRPELRVDASPLATLPSQLGAWRAEDVPLEAAVESMLKADCHLQRAYFHPLGETVWLYVGYYGTSVGGRPEHVPRFCYRAHGWRIESQRTLRIDAATDLWTNEYVVERDGQRRLVYFWYRSHRRTGMLGGFGLSVDHLLGRFLEARADGALVRISTPIESREDVTPARSRLVGFAAGLDPLLDAHWPTETPIRAEG